MNNKLAGAFRLLAWGMASLGRFKNDLSARVLGGYSARNQRINRKVAIIYNAHQRNQKRLSKRTDLHQKSRKFPKGIHPKAAELRSFKLRYNLI